MSAPEKWDSASGSGSEDTGCPIAPKCLECPMPFCVFDVTERSGKIGGYFHRARLYPLILEGKDAHQLVELDGMNISTAYEMRTMFKKVKGDYVKFVLGK